MGIDHDESKLDHSSPVSYQIKDFDHLTAL